MDYKSQTCCFTGHRDIAPYTPDTVFEQTKAVVTLLVSKGFKYFGTGGALGFDTIAAQAVMSVKETHPEVKLILVLPCENQTKYWKQQDIDVYNDIKLRADKVKVLALHYYNGCMQKRNRHLVDCSSACVCFLTKHEGGTTYTYYYTIKETNKFEAYTSQNYEIEVTKHSPTTIKAIYLTNNDTATEGYNGTDLTYTFKYNITKNAETNEYTFTLSDSQWWWTHTEVEIYLNGQKIPSNIVDPITITYTLDNPPMIKFVYTYETGNDYYYKFIQEYQLNSSVSRQTPRFE